MSVYQPESEKSNDSSTNKALGIVGLVIAIISLIFSFIPCVGYWALVPGLLGAIFGLVTFLNLKKSNQPSGVSLAALIIGLLAVGIAITQYYVFREAHETLDELQGVMEDFEGEMIDAAIENTLDSLSHDSAFMESIGEEILEELEMDTTDMDNGSEWVDSVEAELNEQ